MPANMRFEPLRYDPSFEVIAPDEETTNRQITETMRSISQKTFDDTGHANRAVHAKAHALLTGEMKVLDGLPPIFAQGIFAASRTYPIVLRFSTTPGAWARVKSYRSGRRTPGWVGGHVDTGLFDD